MLLNLGCAAKQMQTDGALSGSMLCLNFFQGLYVWDSLHNEQATAPARHGTAQN